MAVSPTERAERRRDRRAVGLLSWVLALALAVGWVVFLRPSGLGGPAGYVIVSGASMEPMMHTGDLVIVRRQAEYRAGDVVAYRIPKSDVGGGMLVIHRIIGGNATDGLILQGDNRDTQDMWRPRAEDVVGSLWWHIPHVGTVLFLLRTPLVIAGVIGFLGFWFVATSPERKPTADDELIELDDLPRVPIPPVVVQPVAAVAARRRTLASPATLAAGAVLVLSAVSAVRAQSARAGA